MKTLLIIEDDVGISKSLQIYLENSNYKVELHHDGDGAVNKIKRSSPDLVILDINLPNVDGIEICKEVRTFSKLPIVMLTARSGELDKINGLEIGADDYIAKPFSPRELLARIKGVLRRFETDVKDKPDNKMSFKGVVLFLDKLTMEVDGKSVTITKNEFDILKKIIKEDGKLVSRETLMTKVIGYDKYIYDRTLDTHIKNLRKKMGDNEIILTVRGEGYRLNK